jgi:hypothetical protein
VIAHGTFDVTAFVQTDVTPSIVGALPVGVATIDKTFDGDVVGTSVAVFTSAFNAATGVGTYTALESFTGSLNGSSGSFSFVHTASTSGADRSNEFFLIIPSSGTGSLAGIRGSGLLAAVGDSHTIMFDYELTGA